MDFPFAPTAADASEVAPVVGIEEVVVVEFVENLSTKKSFQVVVFNVDSVSIKQNFDLDNAFGSFASWHKEVPKKTTGALEST